MEKTQMTGFPKDKATSPLHFVSLKFEVDFPDEFMLSFCHRQQDEEKVQYRILEYVL